MTQPTIFGVTPTASPKEIGRAVAHDLCARLPNGPWEVTASGLKAKSGGQVTEIVMRRLRGSQTGIGVWFEPRLVVRDPTLRTWRRQHPELALNQGDVLFSWNVRGLGTTGTVVILTTDDPDWQQISARGSTYGELIGDLCETVLPVRDHLRSAPGLLELPSKWLDAPWPMSLMEYAIAQDEPTVCARLLERCVVYRSSGSMRERFEQGQQRFRAGLERDMEAASLLGYQTALLGKHYDFGPSAGDS